VAEWGEYHDLTFLGLLVQVGRQTVGLGSPGRSAFMLPPNTPISVSSAEIRAPVPSR